MSKTYRVGGMTCEGCARSVTKAIQSAAPGTDVQVNLESGTVLVSSGAESKIKQAVEDAGFEYHGAMS